MNVMKSWFLLNQDSSKVHTLQFTDRHLSFCYYEGSLPTPIFFYCVLAIYFWKKPYHLFWFIFHNLDFADCIPVVKFYPPFVFEIWTPNSYSRGSPEVTACLPLPPTFHPPSERALSFVEKKCPRRPLSQPAGVEGWGVRRGASQRSPAYDGCGLLFGLAALSVFMNRGVFS